MFLISFLICKLVLSLSDDGEIESSDSESDDHYYDWLASLLLVPLSSAGIFTMYSSLLHHHFPWSALCSTVVSAVSLSPSLYTIFLHVRVPFLLKTIFYCLRGQSHLSVTEASLIKHLWIVSAGYILCGAVPLLPVRQLQQSKIVKKVRNYYSTTVLGFGILCLGCAICISLLLPASARNQLLDS